MDAVMRDSVG